MKNNEENRTAFERLLSRLEALAVENSRVRDRMRTAESDLYSIRSRTRELEEVREHLHAAVLEIERMKKRHPKMVKLPKFMQPLSDEDIPF